MAGREPPFFGGDMSNKTKKGFPLFLDIRKNVFVL
jgi:hypothetical protein